MKETAIVIRKVHLSTVIRPKCGSFSMICKSCHQKAIRHRKKWTHQSEVVYAQNYAILQVHSVSTELKAIFIVCGRKTVDFNKTINYILKFEYGCRPSGHMPIALRLYDI